MNQLTNEAVQTFKKHFGTVLAATVSYAPGRVNLIGEHTDYNGGFVLPMAIDFGVAVAGVPVDGRVCRLFSADYNESAEFSLDDKFGGDNPRWSQYVEGVLRTIELETGKPLSGMNAVIRGNVPQGSGLSSSAALEVSTGLFCSSAMNLGLSLKEIALSGQKAENDFMGVRCGIMDQFASALCKNGSALFLDCRSLEYRNIPVSLPSHTFMILDSRKSRGLMDSAYNERRRACEEGVKTFRSKKPEASLLRDISLEFFEEHADDLSPDVRRRCKHVVYENERVLKAVESLENGDLTTFGNLMWESHESLRDDYEVSCEELDVINEICRIHGGVLGERMTGAGFGGCSVALVEKCAVESLSKELVIEYEKKTGRHAKVYLTSAAGGAFCEKASL